MAVKEAAHTTYLPIFYFPSVGAAVSAPKMICFTLQHREASQKPVVGHSTEVRAEMSVSPGEAVSLVIIVDLQLFMTCRDNYWSSVRNSKNRAE